MSKPVYYAIERLDPWVLVWGECPGMRYEAAKYDKARDRADVGAAHIGTPHRIRTDKGAVLYMATPRR